MPYKEKDLNDRIALLDENQTLLDMLLELEGVLDRLNLYAYKNWDCGEILSGPDVSRHFIAVDLMYPEKCMPDPAGAKRLLKRGIPVKYSRDTLAYPKKLEKTQEIIDKANQSPRGAYSLNDIAVTKNEVATDNVWIVTIQMPRKYLDSSIKDFVEVDEDEFVDTEATGDVATQQAQQSLDPTAGVDPVNTDDTAAGGEI